MIERLQDKRGLAIKGRPTGKSIRWETNFDKTDVVG